MIILLGFYKRRPDLTWEQFSDHWRNVHGPLLRDTPQASRYIKRYVQHHLRPRNPPIPGAQSLEFDGFSEAWFESAEAREEMHRQTIFKDVMHPDELKFLDPAATRVSMVDVQYVQIAGQLPLSTEFSFGTFE
ncbi:EthD domain-containing protein [Rhizorhabdus argentea]|uniref:EthD domain-containing protein n=1 Tax=Rhizorhabdus argentea TaxID=1387174 RepID=UPI0030ECE0DE